MNNKMFLLREECLAFPIQWFDEEKLVMAIICWFMFRFENRNDIVLDVVEAISIHPNAMFYHKNWKLIAIL